MTQKQGGSTQVNIITISDLSKAIIHKLGVNKQEAQRIAGFILDIFGYEDRVIDNVLDLEDRQLFYILEEEGMITSGREVTILYNGREWLTHYWQLKRNSIIKYAKNGKKRIKNEEFCKNSDMNLSSCSNIYNSLSKEVWNSRKINRKKPICYFLSTKIF